VLLRGWGNVRKKKKGGEKLFFGQARGVFGSLFGGKKGKKELLHVSMGQRRKKIGCGNLKKRSPMAYVERGALPGGRKGEGATSCEWSEDRRIRREEGGGGHEHSFTSTG